MPYSIQKREDQYCVVGEDGAPIEGGCHNTRGEAEDHMAALYANVEDASYASPSRLRLNLISEAALTADGSARPIHILRTGTFTGMSGRSIAFSPDDLRAIVANFQAGRRKKPPITERHDWGRAIGRMLSVYVDAAGENLYSQPKWTTEGRQLLSEDIYDGFSVELDSGDAGYVLIGGSLTNYPAVDGLEPVTLSAPPIEQQEVLPILPPAAPPASAGTRADTVLTTQPTTEGFIMSDTPIEQEASANVPPALPTALDAYTRQIEARIQAREEAAFARAQSEFERRMQELEQRGQIEAFARNRTMTSLNQPWALPCTPEELAVLLAETPTEVRGKWMQLLSRLTASGLVSFDEIGSSGEAAEAMDQWNALINAKVGAGQSRVQAIQETARQHPHLYAAQNVPAKRGGR